MITQIKRWFQRLFAWWPWQDEPVTTYAPMESSLNRGINAEPIPRPPFDGPKPQPGVAPQVGSQGEPRCSTIEEWSSSDPANAPRSQDADENRKREFPLLPPTSLAESGRENAAAQGEKAASAMPPASAPIPPSAPAQASAPPMTSPPRSTEEQHLEFLRYLVSRGLVNEGFTEGQVPDQYRKK